MRTMLSQIDLIVECRDYRVPLTSRNPLFEETLAGRERMVVYTKRDLGSSGGREEMKVHSKLARMFEESRNGRADTMSYVETRNNPQMAIPHQSRLF